jgi:hypothetical protein
MMADKASADRVAADMKPPNFRAAVQLIRGAIQKKKDRISGINGEISNEWAKVEGNKVNKKAGRIFMMLDKLEHDERTDIMRSLNGMIDAAGWDESASDLVDKASGNVVHLRVGGNAPASDGEDGEGEGGGDDDAEMAEVEAAIAEPAPGARRRGRKPKDDAAAAQTGVAKSADEARDRARSHIAGEAGDEPFTGDNSDLADE